MACYHPLSAWYAQQRGESGKRPITFRFSEGFKDRPVSIPCGTCIGCRLERAREWAVRCMHEASLHDENVFVTLTYDDKHLPPGGSLYPKHMVDFLKRLRFKYSERTIRFFQCGEYGDRLGRPHHHAILFNLDFPDREFYREVGGVRLDTSRELSQLWPFGFSTVGAVTFESAGYVARYTLKKVDQKASVPAGRMKEYLTMSRRPGIGRGWIDKFHSDVYPSDELITNGHITKPPRYYDDQAAKRSPGQFKEVKERRKLGALTDPDGTGRRLVVREAVKHAATRTLLREIE